ncbi:MAG: nickel-responsive transcriptional regulator NikR [Planctomycetota bacterium]
MAARSKVVSFSLDGELLEQLDAWVDEQGFSGRSAALQRLVREELAGSSDGAPDGTAMATVTYVYDHHQRELLERLTHLQHQHLDLVVSTTHVHLDHARCLEVLILRGPGQRVRELARGIANARGVERARVSLLPVDARPVEHGHGHAGPDWHTHAHAALPAKKRAKKRARKKKSTKATS